MAEIESIRWRHFREGVSVRGPAREFQRSRRTIRRALADPGPWEYRRQRLGPCPVLDPVAKVIAGWLEQDQFAPHKQRHTAHRIYERLVTEYEFAGGESSVRRWVREHRPKARGTLTLPLVHDPGVDAQFDFGEAQVRFWGESWSSCSCSAPGWRTRPGTWCEPTDARPGRPGWMGTCMPLPSGAGCRSGVGTTTRASWADFGRADSWPLRSSWGCRARTASGPTTATRGGVGRRGW